MSKVKLDRKIVLATIIFALLCLIKPDKVLANVVEVEDSKLKQVLWEEAGSGEYQVLRVDTADEFCSLMFGYFNRKPVIVQLSDLAEVKKVEKLLEGVWDSNTMRYLSAYPASFYKRYLFPEKEIISFSDSFMPVQIELNDQSLYLLPQAPEIRKQADGSLVFCTKDFNDLQANGFMAHSSMYEDYEVVSAAKQILKFLDLEKKTDKERVEEVCGYIYSSCAYDIKTQKEIEEGRTGLTNRNGANAYGCLVERKASCSGYAEAVMLCLRLLGYETVIATGAETGCSRHTLNYVKLEDSWYFLDSTKKEEGWSPRGSKLLSNAGYLSEYPVVLAENVYAGGGISPLPSWLIGIFDPNEMVHAGGKKVYLDQLDKIISSNTDVAEINGGHILYKKPGIADITRTDGTYDSTFRICVMSKGPVNPVIKLKSKRLSVIKGNEITLTPKVLYQNKEKLSYKSTNTKVATVTQNGTVSAISTGKAKIIITAGASIAEVEITVTASKKNLEKVK